MSLLREPNLGTSDADLIARVREGDLDAYGVLYERHVGAATALARQISRSSTDADDLVADAFARVLTAIGNGNGPTEAFRPYLLTAVRRRAYDRTDRAAQEELVEDPGTDLTFAELVSELEEEDRVDQALATTAFLTLPERWQAVLWHIEVEESPPAEVGELLGINANATSVLAHRAREGLRQAYLQAHLAQSPPDDGCSATLGRLGAFVRGGLAKRAVAKVELHLHDCARCRRLRDELADLNTTLRRTVAPAVLGPAAAGYLLLQRSGEGAAAATAAAAAGTGMGLGKVAVLVVAAFATLGLLATAAQPTEEPETAPAAAGTLQVPSSGEGELAVAASPTDEGSTPGGAPEVAPLPPDIVPIQVPVGLCGTTMQVEQTVVAADGDDEVASAALLWNDEDSAVPDLDLPAAGTLLSEAVTGTLEDTFAFVTDVTEVVEGGACDLGSVLTQLPEQGVGQWVLVLAVETVTDVVDEAIDLVEGTVETADETVEGLVGFSVADTAAGGALAEALDAVRTTVAGLPGLLADDPGAPGAQGEGPSDGAGTSGGSGSGGGSGGTGGGSGGGGSAPPAPPAPPPTPPTTAPGVLDPVLDPLIGNDPEADTCGLLNQLLGLC